MTLRPPSSPDTTQITGLEALGLWNHVLTHLVRSERPDLTTRQLALYLTIYLIQGEHTVRGLAVTLGLQKPVISRALDRLGQLGFIRREQDRQDRRNVLIRRTVKGAVFLSEFADSIIQAQEFSRPKTAETQDVKTPDGKNM